MLRLEAISKLRIGFEGEMQVGEKAISVEPVGLFSGLPVKKVMQRCESLLLAPATILGTPAEAGLNQKASA
jgi:hypothetical protein